MKNYTMNLKNSKGAELLVTLELIYLGQPAGSGSPHKFGLKIIEASEPCKFIPMPTGYYDSGIPVSTWKAYEHQPAAIYFGMGEIKRMHTYPFCIVLINFTGKKDIFRFTIPNFNIKDFQP